ncbi:uroporphyrin-III C-methyltransferase [Deferribacter desulfuricans SSM1]|uniref:uroporphyrinogen-III C-methyltransferase n=1 Tax=Deferribacter desulfuricans (strain DSM 14783 / JCM 11476 / NBRC 101012 / SSM1) TaxID=639282 RepID=D3P9W5_DEFDS|nr:uroporphyrinogen-III C-methyltransferase [Deferribacter desulfuricans]BAI81505.1 uroporphyrin-III C-methyltransferase [Deferribacter desulfuricans SSM1]
MRKLILIGAGLNKDLITLKGLNKLKEADIILYDRLVDNSLLDVVNCEKVFVGKTPYKPSCSQCEINSLIEKALLEDKTVVRLKGGDASIYSRSLEEIEVARRCDAIIEIIPGVTTVSQFVAKLETALTARGISSGVIFITGHKKDGELNEAYNWKAIVDLNMSIVVYMGVKNFMKILNLLLENGLSEKTPVAIGEKLDFDDEKIIVSDVENLFNFNFEIKFPAIMLIGEVVKSSNFFTNSFTIKGEGCTKCKN